MARNPRGVLIAILTMLVAALLPAASASATVYTVTPGVADNVDSTPDDGICGSGGICSLRAAVQTANGAGAPGFDTIEVPPNTGFGPFVLTRPNTAGDEDAAVEGDIDITTNIEIKGVGGTPTISGNTPTAVDRIFEISSGGPTVTLTNLVITKGQAPTGEWGGAIKQDSGSLTIANTRITDNSVPASGGRGGGIYSSGASSLTLTDTRVDFNHAATLGATGGWGGGIWTQTPVTLTRTSIDTNDASLGCGGICGGTGGGLAASGGGTLTNVTVTGNIAGGNATQGAGSGGGINQSGDALTLVNSTIASNHVQGPNGLGGGNIVSGNIFLQSTIVADGNSPDQTGAENCALDNPPGFHSLGNNLEARTGQGTSQCGLTPGVNGDQAAASAGLGTFDFHGGTTPNYNLLPGSLAIDAGALTGPATDQRGVARPVGPRCDIGAHELEYTSATPAGSTCAGPPPSGPGITPPTLTPPSVSPPPPSPRKCKKGRKLKKGKCVKKKKRR